MKILILLTFIKIVLCEYDKRIITTLKHSKYHVVPTIVNGEPAAPGQMPYLVSIKEPIRKLKAGKEFVWASLCGASIISEMKVLTAAHCFEGRNFFYTKHPNVLRLVAGNLNSELVHTGETETGDQVQWRQIKKLFLHHYFAFPENDIALIYVDVPWNFTDYVSYAILATRTTDYPSSCYSGGFGMTGHSQIDKLPPVLLHARLDILTRSQCTTYWEMNMNAFICTGSAVSDVGLGDSGGPLVCRFTVDPAEEPGRDLLVGVVSGKNYDKTSLFTRISKFRSWIKDPTSTGFKLRSRLFLIIITFLILKYPLFH